MKLLAIPPLLLAIAMAMPASAQGTPTERLHALFEQAWQRHMREHPVAATYYGDSRYNDRWADLSPAALAARDRRNIDLLETLEDIPVDALPAGERLNYELFRRLYERRVERYELRAHLRPLDQLNYSGSVQTLGEIARNIRFDSMQDHEDWIARMRGFGTLVDQVIELSRRGMAQGYVQPRVIVERVLSQVRRQIVEDPRRSLFFQPFTRFADTVAPADRERLIDAATAAVREDVVPAFRRLSRFIEQEYLPASRTTVGIWDTPRGDEFYAEAIEWFTTTSLSAAEIHAIGLDEVKRIRGEMQEVIDRVGFEGTFAEFIEYLRTDPRFRYDDPDELLEAYMVMAKRIDPLLTRFFGRLPRTPYGVRPIPALTAPDTTTAYYSPPSADGRRPGYFSVNLYRPGERPTYEIPVLTAHEAVPGHHVQIALAQELTGLPKFRRDFEATAFVEGWALYAESLAEEMGLFEDPYDKFGQLTYEMWRAVRLVIDTGIHHEHWTRERAIAYFEKHTAKTELDIVNEVDRYIAWPGQALAYKIGGLKFKELRRRATEALGERFDLRAFHDLVLGSGAVPLDVLEDMVEDWIDAVGRGRSTT